MAVKKALRRLAGLFAAAALAGALCIGAAAAQLLQPGLEQVHSCWPQVQVWLHLLDEQDSPLDLSALRAEDVALTVDGAPLQVQAVTSAAQAPTTVFYLLDVSTSMPQQALRQAAQAITAHWQALPANEHIVVVTFGEEIRVLCDESDTAATAAEKLADLRPVEEATRLYDGIDKIAEHVAALQDAAGRGVIVLASDGVDYAAAGLTREEVLAKLHDADLTLCALGVKKAANDADLQQMGELARASGGWMACAPADELAQAAGTLLEGLRHSVCITACADSNIIGRADKHLSVTLRWQGHTLQTGCDITVTRWQPDEQPPEVSLVGQDAQTVTLAFSEPVSGADKAANYGLAGAKDTLTPEYVVYDPASCTVQLHFASPVYNGSYRLTLQGITDLSAEANPLSVTELPLEQTNVKMPFSVWLRRHPVAAVGVPSLAVLLALGVIILLLRRRRTLVHEVERVVEAPPVHLQLQPTLPLTLVVSPEGQPPQRLTAHLEDERAFVVGRSGGSCDIGVQDAQMSRRHFALQWDAQASAGTGVTVWDLDSTNGTQLNGIPLTAPCPVQDGDVLTAGNTRIIVYF